MLKKKLTGIFQQKQRRFGFIQRLNLCQMRGKCAEFNKKYQMRSHLLPKLKTANKIECTSISADSCYNVHKAVERGMIINYLLWTISVSASLCTLKVT